MIADVVLGAQWGDEGKGKIVHWLQTQVNYDWVVRMAGGNNAGHTIRDGDKKYTTHFIPSIRYDSNTKAFLGAGMVIHLPSLLKEVEALKEIFPNIASRIYVDINAFLIEEKHLSEDSEDTKIGTTKKGIGPAYRDKINRKGRRIYDLFLNPTSEIKKLISLGVSFISTIQWKEMTFADTVLFEGAQGVMLDVDLGVYPYVTSSNCSLAPIVASGMAFSFRNVYGVFKAYCTRVGNGPFPTEIREAEVSDKLTELGNEFGSTTGRRRRVGWLDIPALKYAVELSGINQLIMTKIDILQKLSSTHSIFCGTHYNINVENMKSFENANPMLTHLRGSMIQDQILSEVRSGLGMSVSAISFGPETEKTFFTEPAGLVHANVNWKTSWG